VTESAVENLEEWYASQCDGDWESQYGIRIETLGNPGWHLVVDLVGTQLSGKMVEGGLVERSADDWLHFRSDGLTFEANAGARNLTEALLAFRNFSTGTHESG
jgi:hypothetical protein